MVIFPISPIKNGDFPSVFLYVDQLPFFMVFPADFRRVTMLESIMVAASASVRATRTRGEFSTSAWEGRARKASPSGIHWGSTDIHSLWLVGPQTIAQLVHRTPMSLWFMVYGITMVITIVAG